MNRINQRFAALTAALGLAALLGGCAVVEKDNRRLLNALDEAIKPKSTAARVALAPVMIPVGTAALATDAAVIQPIASIPQCWDDVDNLYWTPRGMDSLRKSLYFPLVTVLTPPTFAGDVALRTLFPID